MLGWVGGRDVMGFKGSKSWPDDQPLRHFQLEGARETWQVRTGFQRNCSASKALAVWDPTWVNSKKGSTFKKTFFGILKYSQKLAGRRGFTSVLLLVCPHIHMYFNLSSLT